MSDELEVRKLNKTESWELTDEIRQGFETIHENRLAQVDRLARAYEGYAWEGMGYDSFDEYKAEEFGDDLQQQRLELEERISAVKVLTDAGMAKVEIADILGIHRNSVTNLLKRIDAQPSDDAQRCASNEVDAAGQSVESIGFIEDDDCPSQTDPEPAPRVINISQVSDDDDEESEEERKASLDAWLNNIDFGNMVINTPPQIIDAAANTDTKDYFQPRTAPPKPLEVIKPTLPPPLVKAYDEPTSEFVEPPLKLQKVQDPNKDDSKHCKTCACSLLP